MKIKSTIKTLEIENTKGKKRLYSFDSGNSDILENWQKRAQEISDQAGKLDSSDLKKVYDIERDFIVMVFGVKAWKQIAKDCNNSIFALFPVLMEISRIITESIDENMKVFKK